MTKTPFRGNATQTINTLLKHNTLMVTFILLDICEVVKFGFAFGFVFGAIGTSIQAFVYWKQDRFKAYLQLGSAVIYIALAVVLLIKNA